MTRKALIFIPFALLTRVIYAQPVADFFATNLSGCEPLTNVTFTSTSTGSPTNYLWDFGDGNTSNLVSPSHNFANAGTYTIKLTVSNASGANTKTRTSYIIVFKKPVPDFTANKLGGCAPDSVCFTDISRIGDAPITYWSWDFGDGNASLKQHPCNLYTFSAQFRITLFVRDANGCQDVLIRNNLIDIAPGHTISFTADKVTACKPPLAVTFTDTVFPANPTYIYFWDFGDGFTSTQKKPVHTYTTSGAFTVTERVSTPNGCVKTLVKKSYIYIPNVKANYSIPSGSGCAPLTFKPTNLSTPDSSLVTYTWSVSPTIPILNPTSKEPTLTFTNPGTYTISLRAATGGCADTLKNVGAVTVFAKPTASFLPTTQKFCLAPATVNFTDQSNNAISWLWDFGDGNTSTQQNPPAKTYTNYGKYDVKLMVASSQGCKDTALVKNSVQISPSGFTMNISPRSGCNPLPVKLGINDTSVVPFTSWDWKVDGVSVSSAAAVNYTISTIGAHVVTCTASNSFGCTMTQVDTVKVDIPPVPKFSIDKHSACHNDATFTFTNLTNTSLPNATGYVWNFGNGTKSSLLNPPPVYYADTGRYIISLVASNNGCISEPFFDTIVIKPPIANLVLPVVNCANDTLQFLDNSKVAKNGGNKWFWDFGDGDSSVVRNPRHQYINPGKYTVKLRVTDTLSGCSDIDSDFVTISAPPKVMFSQSDSIICPGTKITFTDKTTVGTGISIASWTYRFGDGQFSAPPATTKNPVFTFSKTGYMYAQLTIKDNRNCFYTYKKDSAIYVSFITAKFNVVQPDSGCISVLMSVVDSSVSQYMIMSRKWTWGTGDSTITDSATKTASYLYTKVPPTQNAGYTINLLIKDSAGCTATAARVVHPSWPVPAFTTSVIKRCGFDSVVFSSTSTGYTPFRFKWSLPNKDTSSSAITARKYPGDTTYSVRLIVTDHNGCVDSVTRSLSIKARLPVAGFKANPLYIPCPPGNVSFTDTTVVGGSKLTSWLWDFGDGSQSHLQNPAKTYYIPGVYPISLKITDSVNCVSSENKPGYLVIGGAIGTYTVIPNKGCTPLTVSFKGTSTKAKIFDWDFADGVLDSSGNSVSHKYVRDAIYIPQLILVDSNGCAYALPRTDTITVYPLPKPDFDIDRKAICKDGFIIFTDKSTHPNHIPFKSYLWKFGTGDSSTSPGPVLTYQYNKAGKFTISLTLVDTLGCRDTLTKDSLITVVDDTIPPATPTIFRATVVDNISTLLEHTSNHEVDWYKYTLYYNYLGTPAPFSNLVRLHESDTTFNETPVNTLDEVYSYMVTATDVCNNESPPSSRNTTMNVEATALVNAVKVDWTAYEGWDSVLRYEVFRLDSLLPEGVYIASVGRDTLTFTDTNTVCYKPFFYHIKAVQDGGLQQISWSDTAGAVPIYQPTMPATQNIRATVLNDKDVLLQWRKRTHKLPFTYLVYRMEDEAIEPVFYKELDQNDTFLVDEGVDVHAHSYAYITYLKDNCGGLSPESNVAKTILLKAELEQNDILKYDPVIMWSPYARWNSGIDHYKVEFYYDSAGGFAPVGIKPPGELSLSHRYVNLEQREYCYKVTAYQADSLYIFSESNTSCISTAPRLYAPNVFTVNGDNLNEVFQLGGVFLDTYHLFVYNRWGELMFESNDIHNSWDGTYNGKPCKSDVYVYLAEGTGRKGQRITLKGNVTLLR